MLYLGWIIAAFLIGVLTAPWFSFHVETRTLRDRFSNVGSFLGQSYTRVRAMAGVAPCRTERRPNGQVLRTWRDADYSITLIFNEQDVCLGVEEERMA